MISGPLSYRDFRETGPRARTRTAHPEVEHAYYEATLSLTLHQIGQ